MKRRAAAVNVVVVGLAAACSSPAPRPAPAPPVPEESALPARTCTEAAARVETTTRHVRPPDASVLEATRARCVEDGWSSAVIECFATMSPDDLGRCAGALPPPARAALLAVVGGTDRDDAVALDGIVARLTALQIGVSACDRFVAAVTTMMGCDRLSLTDRVALGTETLDFWSLPTSKLSADGQARVASLCGSSLAALQQQASDVGCMP